MSPIAIFRKYELQNYIVYLGFIAIFLFFAVTLHDAGFTSTRNLTNIILQTAPATIMAIGLVFALSAGEIDLSLRAWGLALLSGPLTEFWLHGCASRPFL